MAALAVDVSVSGEHCTEQQLPSAERGCALFVGDAMPGFAVHVSMSTSIQDTDGAVIS